jgi:peptidoglycan/LPS O-acetylase OafA/YrhL
MTAASHTPSAPSSGNAVRLDSLTGLRFAAALAVFAHHITILLPQTAFRHVESTMRVGPTGVSFFFVLSGFVLLWSRRGGDSSVAFLQRRISRIWPSHAVTWVAGLVLVYATEKSFFVKSSVLNLAMLQVWVPRQTWYFSVNVVSWSLAIEWFFYLMFAFLVVPILRLSPKAAARAAVGLALGFVVLEIALHVALRGNANLQQYFVYIFPPTRLFEFALGMCLARSFPALPRISLPGALALAGVAMLLDAMVPEPLRWTAVTIVPFALVIVAAAQADVRGERTFWATPTMVRLGTWSFAFYLVHQLVIRTVDELFPLADNAAVGIVVIAAIIAISLALAALLHRLIEVPAERVLRRVNLRAG